MCAMNVLPGGHAHVWAARNNHSHAILRTLEDTLSSSERIQAEKFRFDRHRIQYIFAHGVLRQIIAGYSRCRPHELTFGTNEYGKPFVRQPGDEAALMFNMSHSEAVVLVGLTVGRPIGVDVELVRPIPGLEEIAGQHFADEERALIEAAGTDDRERLFYICWTRKEAYWKAVGTGLSVPLNSFGTAMPVGTPGRQLSETTTSHDVRHWWLSDLAVPGGYVGALA